MARPQRPDVIPGNQPATTSAAASSAVDLATGKVETLYTRCDGRPLRGPNDLVFDSAGGFWFTDHGKIRERATATAPASSTRGPTARSITEVIFPLERRTASACRPTGTASTSPRPSPAGSGYWDLDAPGRASRVTRGRPDGGHLLAGAARPPALRLAGDRRRRQRLRRDPRQRRHHRRSRPTGDVVEHVPPGDPLTTNICFGGADLRTAYVTLSGTGKFVALDWPRPGLRLQYQ